MRKIATERRKHKVSRMSANQPQNSSKAIKRLATLLAAVVLGAVLIYLLSKTKLTAENWVELWQSVQSTAAKHPWLLLLGICILPGIGAPVSASMILYAAVMTPYFGLPLTLLSAVICLAICTTWTYLISAGPLRSILLSTLLKKRSLPSFEKSNDARLTLILRITPGLPYVIQNIVLGVLRVDFKRYLLISIPTQSLFVIAFILTSGSIFEGRIGLAITGLILLVLAVLITRFIAKKNQQPC